MLPLRSAHQTWGSSGRVCFLYLFLPRRLRRKPRVVSNPKTPAAPLGSGTTFICAAAVTVRGMLMPKFRRSKRTSDALMRPS